MRKLHIAVPVAVLLLLAARLPLAAQSILTTVVEAETGRPVTSSLVVLLDAAGRQVAGAVTGVEGQVTLRAPAPGTYRLRTERVGFATTLSAPFELVDGQRLSQRVEVSAAAIMLEGLVARGTRRCVLRPEEGTQTQKVWEEARKALNATAWTEALGLVQYRSVGYRRELDHGTQRVSREEVSPRSGAGGRPYQSLPAEELATHGYVQRDGDGWMHYAPDAEVLLSDDFQDTHCLRVQKGTGEHEGRVGLAFEPMRGARLPTCAACSGWTRRARSYRRWSSSTPTCRRAMAEIGARAGRWSSSGCPTASGSCGAGQSGQICRSSIRASGRGRPSRACGSPPSRRSAAKWWTYGWGMWPWVGVERAAPSWRAW